MNRSSNHPWLFGVVLFVAVVTVYSPVWWAGYIWDDDVFVTGNPLVVGSIGLKAIWTKSVPDIAPLTITTFWLEHKLWGLNPLGFHLLNVFIHGGSAIVLWRVLRQLAVPGAWLGAALWACHPVLVESVAWVSQLKNTQSTFFYLLSILFFARWVKMGAGKVGDWNYALTLVFAALGMASKSSTVILPVELILCAWWIERGWKWRSLAAAAATFVFSAISAGLELWTEGIRNSGPYDRSWPQRFIGAGDAVWFYLGKLVWPHPLLANYPRWNVDAANWIEYLPLLAVIALLAIFWLQRDSWGRPWFFALAYFIAALLPALGLVQHYFLRFSLVADHFQNLACMGPLALIGAGISLGAAKLISGKAWLGKATGTGLVAVLAALSWNQAWLYENQRTLWTYTVSHNPAAYAGYNNLGLVLMDEGKLDEAIADFEKALKLSADYPEAQTNLGIVLTKKGQVGEALAHFREAFRLNPNFSEAVINLGAALDQKGASDEAIADYQKALVLQPYESDIYYNLGIALEHKGRLDEAIAAYRKALAMNASNGKVHGNLAVDLMQQDHTDEAIDEFRRAAKLDPGNLNAHENLGLALLTHDRAVEAIGEYLASLNLDPNDAAARLQLGLALLQVGRTDEALAQLQELVKQNPDNAAARNCLGAALLKVGRDAEAIPEFQQALRLQPDFSDAQANLSKALAAEKGK